MIVLHLIVICLLLTNIRSIQLYPMPCISYSKILCLVHLRYSLFPANTILKMLLVTQFAYFASLQKPPFEEFSCVLLFLLRYVEAFAGSRQSMYRGESDPRGPGLLYSTPSPIPRIPLYHRTHHALTYPWTTNANIFLFCSFLITCAFETKPETRQDFASVHYSMKLVTVPQLYPPTVALYQPTYRSVQWGRTGVGRGKGLGRKD